MEKNLDEKRLIQPGPTEEWLKTCAFREQWNSQHEGKTYKLPEPAFRIRQNEDKSYLFARNWRPLHASAYSTLPRRLAEVDLSGLDTESMLIMFNVQFPYGALVSYDLSNDTKLEDFYWMAVIIKLWRSLVVHGISSLNTGHELFLNHNPFIRKAQYGNR
jgi:hypothetical protein